MLEPGAARRSPKPRPRAPADARRLQRRRRAQGLYSLWADPLYVSAADAADPAVRFLNDVLKIKGAKRALFVSFGSWVGPFPALCPRARAARADHVDRPPPPSPRAAGLGARAVGCAKDRRGGLSAGEMAKLGRVGLQGVKGRPRA